MMYSNFQCYFLLSLLAVKNKIVFSTWTIILLLKFEMHKIEKKDRYIKLCLIWETYWYGAHGELNISGCLWHGSWWFIPMTKLTSMIKPLIQEITLFCKVIRVETRTTNYKQSPTTVNIDRPAHIKTDKQCRTHTTSTARLPDD